MKFINENIGHIIKHVGIWAFILSFIIPQILHEDIKIVAMLICSLQCIIIIALGEIIIALKNNKDSK